MVGMDVHHDWNSRQHQVPQVGRGIDRTSWPRLVGKLHVGKLFGHVDRIREVAGVNDVVDLPHQAASFECVERGHKNAVSKRRAIDALEVPSPIDVVDVQRRNLPEPDKMVGQGE